MIEQCTCEPTEELSEVSPGVFVLQVAHDDWCAIIKKQQGKWN